MKKPKMNKYDSIREVKRNIKLTPKQRKQERKDKTDFAYGVASVTPIGGAATRLIRAGKGLSRASRAFSSTPSKQLKNWDVVGKWDPSKTMTFKAPSKTKAVAMDLAKFNKPNMKKNNNKKRPEAPLQNGKELKPIMIKPNMGRVIKPMAKFPDLSGDGKVTKKDILMGKGVIDKPKMEKNNKSKTKGNVMKGVTISATDPMKDAAREAAYHGKLAIRLMKAGKVKEANAANEAKIRAARKAKDIEFDRLKGGAIDRLTLR
jgi:hypothetical protein